MVRHWNPLTLVQTPPKEIGDLQFMEDPTFLTPQGPGDRCFDTTVSVKPPHRHPVTPRNTSVCTTSTPSPFRTCPYARPPPRHYPSHTYVCGHSVTDLRRPFPYCRFVVHLRRSLTYDHPRVTVPGRKSSRGRQSVPDGSFIVTDTDSFLRNRPVDSVTTFKHIGPSLKPYPVVCSLTNLV